MAQFLVLHSMDPRTLTSEFMMGTGARLMEAFTEDTYVITSWWALGAGKVACLWEAPSETAIIDIFAREVPQWPIDGVYPATVTDMAEVKKMLAGG